MFDLMENVNYVFIFEYLVFISENGTLSGVDGV
jgi:hypothetical protein